MEEIWKDIKGYEGLYKISNKGNLYSLITNKIKKSYITKKGYLRTSLCLNGKNKNFLIHQLVAKAFIPNPENKIQVNHIDCNKQNNCIDNLEWVTNRENFIHAQKNNLRINNSQNLIKHAIKTRKPVLQYDFNGNIIKRFDSITETKKDGFKIGSVCRVCKHNRKTHGGYVWRYEGDDL